MKEPKGKIYKIEYNNNFLTHVNTEKKQNTIEACMLATPIPPGGISAELHCDHK